MDAEFAKIGKDAKIITMTHQNIANHYPNDKFSFKYTITNGEEIVDVMEKYGEDVNLSDHIHLQHIAETQNGLADIATSSMTITNCSYAVVSVKADEIAYDINGINVADWAQKNNVTDENLLDFDNYKNRFCFDSAYPKAMAQRKNHSSTG